MNEDKIIEEIINLKDDVQVIKETMATKADLVGVNDRVDNLSNTVGNLSNRVDNISNTVDNLSNTVDNLSNKVTNLSGTVDKLVVKSMEHDDRLERIEQNMATKADLVGITSTLDRLVVLAEKKDQELTVLAYNLRQVDDKHTKDIQQIKKVLQLG